MSFQFIFSYGIICKDLPEDRKKIFLKACLNYLLKKVSLIISLVVLFVMKIRFFPGKSIANIKTLFQVATASVKGTVIRVFDVSNPSKYALLHELRRGMRRCVSISSLNFSLDSRFLCSSSDSKTVHIFKLTHR